MNIEKKNFHPPARSVSLIYLLTYSSKKNFLPLKLDVVIFLRFFDYINLNGAVCTHNFHFYLRYMPVIFKD